MTGLGGREAERSRTVLGGLVHLGLFYDDPEDLVASALPAVRRAIAAGDEVHLIVDRRTARTFREGLGDDAEHVVFPPPSSMLPPSAPGFLATVQGWARADRRTTVLGQYPATLPATDCGFGEDALNLVLRDLPLTLICTCHHDLDPDLLAVARRTHPLLATPDGPVDNPEFRRPPTTDPVPAGLWGDVAARVGVDGTAGLAEVRQCVADVAERAGLQGDAVRAAVLAVHEAAVLACRTGDPVRAPLVVEVRARPGETLFSEVVGPPAAEEPGDGDPLAHLRPFCTGAHLHDGPEGRAVRVLTTV
ncbi:MEDS domain-containing protein [Actinomycetospora sp. CA-101289]|uniref:MEDS domain-containing protein n=1 Tax=Actinomycetospora sp. CA-101289 TaxID=3239893 RepID=UPI003D98D1CC